MSNPTTADAPTLTPAALTAILSYARYRLSKARAEVAGENGAVGAIRQAAGRLSIAGLSERDKKRLDDVAQLIRTAGEQLDGAVGILDRLADGRPEPEPSDPRGYYDFGGYGPDLGGEGG